MNRFTILISFLFLLLASSCVTEDEPASASLQPGDKCPSFSIEMNTGSVISSESLKGKKSLIVFFNTSCGDCQKELPEIQKVYDYIQSQDLPVNLICISRAESAESIEKYWTSNGLTLPYSAQKDKAVYNLFASSVIPRTYLLSPDLTILKTWSDNPVPTAGELLRCL